MIERPWVANPPHCVWRHSRGRAPATPVQVLAGARASRRSQSPMPACRSTQATSSPCVAPARRTDMAWIEQNRSRGTTIYRFGLRLCW